MRNLILRDGENEASEHLERLISIELSSYKDS